MSIITKYQYFKEYLKQNNDYFPISRWTSSHTVEMDNGNTLEEEISAVGKGIELTQAEYDSLTNEEKNNGTIYYITDGNSDLPVIQITKDDYEKLGNATKNDGRIYLVTDEGYDSSATNINYNNTNSNLNATNVQDAIDEVNSSLEPTAVILTGLHKAASAYRVGKMIFLNYYKADVTIETGSWNTITETGWIDTLPIQNVICPCTFLNTNNTGIIGYGLAQVKTNGSVSAMSNTAISNGHCVFNTSYIYA